MRRSCDPNSTIVLLLLHGVDVAVSYGRSRTEAEQTVERVRAANRRGAAFQADVSKPEACAALVAQVAEAFGRLDILIHMASVYAERAFDQLNAAEWDAVVNVDLRGAFLCAHAAAPHMRKQGGGRIIAFSDWLAQQFRQSGA